MAVCISPLKLKGVPQPVPCYRCIECVKNRVSAWSFRLTQQDKVSVSSYFITLTYDTDNVPITRKGWMTVNKKDVQNFLKRLRKRQEKVEKEQKIEKLKISYYAAAEYGREKGRPHYHIIIFNVRLDALFTKKDAFMIEHNRTMMDGKTEFHSPVWPQGYLTIGDTKGGSVGYTLKYVSKGKWKPKHKNDDRTPEFALMSKGIGANYLTDAMINWHKADLFNRFYAPLENGTKAPLARYYKQKIYTDWQRIRIGDHILKVRLKDEHQTIIKEYARDVDKYFEQQDRIIKEKFRMSNKELRKTSLT